MKNIKSIVLILLVPLVMSCKQNQINNIVVIGDSNGASPIGWVVKLDSMLQNSAILNYSIGGNTIGFDNLGRESLNALKNINKNLIDADSIFDGIDLIIVALGTNDCKAVFDSSITNVPNNMRELIANIKSFPYKKGVLPKLLIISPPEVGSDSMLLPKYYGIGKRLDYLLPQFEKVAKETNCDYLNIRSETQTNFNLLTEDGIHFNDTGYSVIANQVFLKIQKNSIN